MDLKIKENEAKRIFVTPDDEDFGAETEIFGKYAHLQDHYRVNTVSGGGQLYVEKVIFTPDPKISALRFWLPEQVRQDDEGYFLLSIEDAEFNQLPDEIKDAFLPQTKDELFQVSHFQILLSDTATKTLYNIHLALKEKAKGVVYCPKEEEFKKLLSKDTRTIGFFTRSYRKTTEAQQLMVDNIRQRYERWQIKGDETYLMSYYTYEKIEYRYL